VVSLLLILPWNENYGNNEPEEGDDRSNGKTESNSLISSFRESIHVIFKHPTVLCLGLSQAFFEGGMFTFGRLLFLDLTTFTNELCCVLVFMWVPAMIAVVPGPLPTGLVFSSMMLAMTIGGMLSSILLPFIPGGRFSCQCFT
jgi:hypothetical protein